MQKHRLRVRATLAGIAASALRPGSSSAGIRGSAPSLAASGRPKRGTGNGGRYAGTTSATWSRRLSAARRHLGIEMAIELTITVPRDRLTMPSA